MNKIVKESPDNYFHRQGNNVTKMEHYAKGSCTFITTPSFKLWSRNAHTTHYDLCYATRCAILKAGYIHDLKKANAEYVIPSGANVFIQGNLLNYIDFFESGHIGRNGLFLFAQTKNEEAMLGRIWTKQKIASFWNPLSLLKRSDLIPIIHFFQDILKINADDVTYEFTDNDETIDADPTAEAIFKNFTFKELCMKIHHQNNPPKEEIKKEEKPKFNISNALHSIAPELKGNMLKAMGIKPKLPPLSIQQKFALNQDSHIPNSFDSFINTIVVESNLSNQLPKPFLDFFHELALYQSNHYGSYHSQPLYNAYTNLPNDFKLKTQPQKSQLLNIFRGDDGYNAKPVLSFTYNKSQSIAKNNASRYGKYIISLNNLKHYDGLLDTNKLVNYFGKKLWNQITNNYPIGDDENEILAFGVKFK